MGFPLVAGFFAEFRTLCVCTRTVDWPNYFICRSG